MARGAFWRVGAPVLAAAVVAAPAVTRAQDDEGREIVRAFRMARGGSHLGVNLADVGRDDRARLKLSDERGALVKDVQEGTPAAKAGLKADDVIVRFDGEAVRSASQLSRLVRETPSGRPIAIEVNRGGAVQRLTATLDEGGRHFGLLGDNDDMHIGVPPVAPMAPMAPVPPVPSMDQLEPLIREGMDHARRSFWIERPGRLGITYQELSGQLARYFNVEDGSLLVSNVNADTPAAKAGLKAGDVIVKLDGKDVSRQDLREQVAKAEGGSQITLGVQRDGKPVDVTVTLPARDRSRARREPTI
jgi:serine protease Do